MTAIDLVIHGRVQGVFYRDWTVENARALGLAGWVRNRNDGTVAAHLEGDPAAVEDMVVRMGKGPIAARVDRIDRTVANFDSLTEFQRL